MQLSADSFNTHINISINPENHQLHSIPLISKCFIIVWNPHELHVSTPPKCSRWTPLTYSRWTPLTYSRWTPLTYSRGPRTFRGPTLRSSPTNIVTPCKLLLMVYDNNKDHSIVINARQNITGHQKVDLGPPPHQTPTKPPPPACSQIS